MVRGVKVLLLGATHFAGSTLAPSPGQTIRKDSKVDAARRFFGYF